MSWDETLEWADLLELETAPEIYRGEWDEALVREIEIDPDTQEGYVVRVVDRVVAKQFERLQWPEVWEADELKKLQE